MKKRNYGQLLSKLLPYVKPHKTVFFLSVLFDIIAIALNMFIPVLTGFAINTMIGAGNVDFMQMWRYLNGIIILTGTNSVFDWWGSYYLAILTYRTSNLIRNSIYKKLNSVPVKFIDDRSHGDIMNIMIADVENVTDGFLAGFKAVCCGVFQIIIVGIIMFCLQWQLALCVVLVAPLSLCLAIIITRKSKRLYKIKVEKLGEMSGYAEEMITNMKIIKAFNNEQNTKLEFDKINQDLYVSSEKSVFYATLGLPASRLVNGILYGVIGITGAILAINGQVTIGKMSSYLMYEEHFTKPFTNLTNIFADLNVAIASANRVFNLLDERNEISDKDLPELKECNSEVKINKVSFSYEPTFKLIENLSLDVKPGQRVAIVGPTGCGKSTMINLLMRFYDVDKGSIKVSGKDIRKVKRQSFRKYYGMVLQESWLYNASIRDNVAYGKPDATLDEVIEACKMANADAFIEKLPDGYDTIITERADNISAGQKQLLCIARIMLLKPPMMILDEATSNIDTRTEMKIQEALDKIMVGRTCFIVAHRLSTIENADIILVMDKGHIVEQGTHKELLAKGGFYAKLFNSQFGS